MYYVYLLKSAKDKKLYVGYTKDLKRRLTLHNSGQVFSTKTRLPMKLIYCEIYRSEEDAKNREKTLKYQGQGIRRLKERLKESLK